MRPPAIVVITAMCAGAGCGEPTAARREHALHVGATAVVLDVADTTRIGVTLRDGRRTHESPPNRYQWAGEPIAWASDDASVASVNADGVVTARRAGRTILTVRVGDRQDTATVNVRAAADDAPSAVTAGVTAGDVHSCRVSTAGGAACWGSSWEGQLGTGAARPYTATLSPVRVRASVAFTSIDAGSLHTCALGGEGRAYCWGYNKSGQLGDGSTSNASAPVRVLSSVRLVAVTAGIDHSCALAVDGTAHCWGRNDAGQLGNSTRRSAATPQRVAGGIQFMTVTAGGAHSCGVAVDGVAYCWGANDLGQLGTAATAATSAAPAPVGGALRFTSVSAGDRHTCGVAVGGAAYCWGDNRSGQLGIALDGGRNTPTPVDGGGFFLQVSAGGEHSCAVSTEGAGYCWGSNLLGSLGTGIALGLPTPPSGVNPYVAVRPRPVLGGLRLHAISAGGHQHTCALTATQVYCWGNNEAGQIGTGRIDYDPATRRAAHTVPARVSETEGGA